MKTRVRLHSYLMAAAVTVLLFAQQAQACEGCKQAVGMGDGAGGSRTVNSIGIGYALSIGMLLFTLVGVLGGLGYMMYRNCQIIAAQQNAAEQAASLA